MDQKKLADECITTIRCLAMDAVQNANSGHPGTPMALAPAAFVLWNDIMKYNPDNPKWVDRDRFVLSNGHASMLQYAMLYLTGYDISIEDIKQFRQWDSITPGHPENYLTPGVETTTGPLGQGFMNAVGMAMAEAHLSARFNTKKFPVVDHHTYVFTSDGDFMEGASHEAASLAGHIGLGKLVCLYDDNHISIEGETELTYSDDKKKRFEAYHWHVIDLGEKANDIQAIRAAFEEAKKVTDKPSLIILRTHIAYGAPNKQDTKEAHGSALGEEEVAKTKEFYGWPGKETFRVPDDVLIHMRKALDRGRNAQKQWQNMFSEYKKEEHQLADVFQESLDQDLREDWDKNIQMYGTGDGKVATRNVSSGFVNAVKGTVPWLIGGSADLAPSTKTLMDDMPYMSRDTYEGKNIDWGVRELAMCGTASGIMLHGGLRPYVSTFFIFTDYARPAIRLAALMKLPVIYVMTHDSIGLGEDGPTHQPIEHLASMRAMPNMTVIRPADANEALMAWEIALKRKKEGPTMLVLTRQKLPVFNRENLASASEVDKGAYVISPEIGDSPDLIIIASGSEVHLALEAQTELNGEGVDARVVSMPSWELFEEQDRSYREKVLPSDITSRIAIEAGSSFGWEKWIGTHGKVIGIDHFGASAPYEENFKHFGFTVNNIVRQAQSQLVQVS